MREGSEFVTFQQFKEWLDYEIDSAEGKARENREAAINAINYSYGEGYDRGFLDALMKVRIAIHTETPATEGGRQSEDC